MEAEVDDAALDFPEPLDDLNDESKPDAEFVKKYEKMARKLFEVEYMSRKEDEDDDAAEDSDSEKVTESAK